MTRFQAFVRLVVCLLAAGTAFAGAERLVVGEPIDDVRETAHPYVGLGDADVGLDGPQLVWSETLHHPGAQFVAPHFSRFELAPGDRLVVRSPDGKQEWVYEGRGKTLDGAHEPGFWSGHIKGDTAIVELWAGGGANGWGVRIDRYSRGLDDVEIAERNGLRDTRAICGGDDTDEAVCYADSEPEMYDEARAVVRLLISGQFLCTGWLVGCEGHMMTNEHCITSQSEASNTDYEFMAEGGSCSTSCAGSLACGGTVAADTGTLIQDNSALDYSLIKLPGNLSETYGYMQLRADGGEVNERIYIPQHPAGWGKRIGVFSTNGNDQSGFCEISSMNAAPCSGGPGDVGYFCDTQGGSSGSPVLGYADHRVVALHHCANCPNRGVNIVDVIDSLGANLPACSTLQLAGTLTTDRSDVRCEDAIEIALADDSLIGAGTFDVDVSSTTEVGPDRLTLSETSPGLFAGTLLLSGSPAESGDGSLSVAHDDEVVVEYLDADDGTGGSNVLRRTALVDCVAPTIADVQVGPVNGSEASVGWTTDEPSDARLTYSPPAVVEVPAGASTTVHDVALSGLEPCTVHQFELAATDPAGNLTTDTNAGAYYAFQTEFESRPPRDATDTPRAIPDQVAGGANSTITVAGDFPVLDLDVRVTIDHNHTGELGLLLFGPSGGVVRLARRLGGSGDDYVDTWFDDDASQSILAGTAPFTGEFRPESPLSALTAGSPTGDWTLRVIDDGENSVGSVISWTLVLERPAESCSSAQAPGAAPDGTNGGTPLLLDRLDLSGDTLRASFGASCTADATKLIHGPLGQVGDYAISGSRCDAVSPQTLDALPAGSLWFLALGQNAEGAESSWGLSSQGERNGLAASGTCGATIKDLTAICP